MKATIKTSEIKSETISQAMEEIFTSGEEMLSKIRQISDCYNWSMGDTIEAVATKIVIDDEDFILDENWGKSTQEKYQDHVIAFYC